MKKHLATLLVAVAFLATIFGANWALQKFGIIMVLGFAAPCGVFFAGAGFVLRDYLHESVGRMGVLAVIVLGGALSYLVAPAFAVASCAAFTCSELADLTVYDPLRRRTVAGGLLASQVVGAAVDSALFLWLAFHSLEFFTGQFVLKSMLVLPALLALAVYRARGEWACA